MNRRKTIVIVAVALIAGVVAWAFVAGKVVVSKLPSPTAPTASTHNEEKIIGDATTQPTLEVKRLPSSEPGDIQPVIDSAKRIFTPGDEYWPEPALVEEHEKVWDVWFPYREKLVEVNGKQLVKAQMPGWCEIEVQKADLSARGIPLR